MKWSNLTMFYSQDWAVMDFLGLDVFLIFLFRNRNVIWKSINET